MLYGYANMNWMLAQATFALSRLIEKNGYIAMPIPPSPPNDSENLVAMLSNRHAAVAAGLGELGWNSLLITRKTAGRLRLVSLITDAALEPDPILAGEPICNPEQCGYVCAKACPVNAISTTKSVEFSIAGRLQRHGVVNKWLCRSRQIAGAKGPWRPLIGEPPPLPKEITPEDWRARQKYTDPWDAMESNPIGRGDRCGQCIMVCPVALR
ncbi:MAG: hypothetical protein HY675_24140, partial [Chloroflexi bacterium]|nr:hypothetical protein [Chloroflexota bacterium]